MRKILLFILLTNFAFSCSEDDWNNPSTNFNDANHHQNAKKENVNIQQMKSYIKEYTDLSFLLPLNPELNKGVDYIEYIDSTNITKISYNGITSFTLFVNTLDDEFYNYSNLIVEIKNGEINQYIYHYIPTEEWQNAFNSGEKYSYEGEFIITDIKGNEINSNSEEEYSRGGFAQECLMLVTVDCYGNKCPCKDGNGETFFVKAPCNDDPGQGGGSGGGSSGGGGTTPGGYTPTDPNPGGGSGGNDPITFEPPCEQLENQSNDSIFKNKMDTLKNNVDGEKEKGFMIFNDNPMYSPIIIADDYGHVDFDIQNTQFSYATGAAHNHLSDRHIAVFTPEDLCVFATIANFTGEPIENLTFYLVSKEGLYAIKIKENDLYNLLNFALKYLNDLDYRAEVLNSYDNNNLIHGKPKGIQEKGFLEIVKEFNIGLEVYECDENYQNWKKLVLTSNDILVKTPC